MLKLTVTINGTRASFGKDCTIPVEGIERVTEIQTLVLALVDKAIEAADAIDMDIYDVVRVFRKSGDNNDVKA